MMKLLPSGAGRLRLVMWIAILVSVAGIPFAVFLGVAVDGGRGGAIAVALTFFTFFMDRGTAERALEAKIPDGGDPATRTDLELARVRNAVASMLDWSRQERLYLTVSSVVGTLAWGFGDVVARWLGAT